MKTELSIIVMAFLKRPRNPKLTIALAAIFVVLALIRTLREFIGAPLPSLVFLLIACSLILGFTAWVVVKVIEK